jgi:hypothetical protein
MATQMDHRVDPVDRAFQSVGVAEIGLDERLRRLGFRLDRLAIAEPQLLELGAETLA